MVIGVTEMTPDIVPSSSAGMLDVMVDLVCLKPSLRQKFNSGVNEAERIAELFSR